MESLILNLSPIVGLWIFLIGLGAVLKRMHRFSNDDIPAFLMGAGAIVYPFIADAGRSVFANMPYPGVYKVIIGAIIGFGAVGGHQFAKKWVKKKFDIDLDIETEVKETHVESGNVTIDQKVTTTTTTKPEEKETNEKKE